MKTKLPQALREQLSAAGKRGWQAKIKKAIAKDKIKVVQSPQSVETKK